MYKKITIPCVKNISILHKKTVIQPILNNV